MTPTEQIPDQHQTAAPSTRLVAQRVRHPLMLRRVAVRRVQDLSAHLRRITFGGPDLDGFVSASFDDHVKLMFNPDGPLVLPTLQGEGAEARPRMPEGVPMPVMRDYTPRRLRPDVLELDIDFMLHGDGPAARWAATAQPGTEAGIGGPRGSFVVPTGFDWHLLAGDAAALPAIARRLEELPPGTPAIVLLELDPADQPALDTRAALTLHRLAPIAGASGEATALVQAAAALQLPPGDGYAWGAGEAAQAAALRRVLVEGHGLARDRLRVSSYWRRGSAGFHETLAD